MQNNSQGRRDRFDSKNTPVHEEPNTRSDSRTLRTEGHPVDEAAPAEETKNFASGVVTDCLKLNVRKDPDGDADVLVVINALSEVTVDMDASTDEFYKVRTAAGIEGFCMKKYIALKR